MAFKDKVQGFLDGIDLLAARLRGPLHSLTLALIAAQGAYAVGALDQWIPKDSKWAKWASMASGIIALYTMRKREASSLLQAKKIEAGIIAPSEAVLPPKP